MEILNILIQWNRDHTGPCVKWLYTRSYFKIEIVLWKYWNWEDTIMYYIHISRAKRTLEMLINDLIQWNWEDIRSYMKRHCSYSYLKLKLYFGNINNQVKLIFQNWNRTLKILINKLIQWNWEDIQSYMKRLCSYSYLKLKLYFRNINKQVNSMELGRYIIRYEVIMFLFIFQNWNCTLAILINKLIQWNWEDILSGMKWLCSYSYFKIGTVLWQY